METIIEILGPTIALLLAAGLTAAITWIAAKLGIKLPPESVADAVALARKVIMRAEDMAKAGAISKADKMPWALKELDRLAAEYPKAKAALRGGAERLLESVLRSRDLVPDEVVPHDQPAR